MPADATPVTQATEPSAAGPVVAPMPAEPQMAEAALTLAERIRATARWLERTPDSHYFVQLLVVDAGSEKEVLDFIARSAAVLDLRQLRVYRSSLSGQDRLGVIYGDYPSREKANAALAALGEVSPASKPYVRAVGRLR